MADECELYDSLVPHLMSERNFEVQEYPRPDPLVRGVCKPPPGKQFFQTFIGRYLECRRCRTKYQVSEEGVPLVAEPCYYHHGPKQYGAFECCGRVIGSQGCKSNWCHTQFGYQEFETNSGFVQTGPKPERGPDNKHGIYALDCEMCTTVYGYEVTRVTILNYMERVVYNKLVRPRNMVLDYNTIFSGISESDLMGVSTTLADVQRDLLELFSDKTILVGHGLYCDLRSLKLFHGRVVDTVQLYPHKRPLPFKMSLKRLAMDYLQTNIQTGPGHDSEEDARTALRLALRRARR